MEERPRKLRRTEAFRRALPHLSAVALASVLARVVDVGVPELRSRENFREARDACAFEDTPYGPLIRTIPMRALDGTLSQRLEVVHPLAMLWVAAREGAGFGSLLLHMLHTNAPTITQPWRLALYSDEVVPGNVLSHDNKRKIWAVYWSLIDLSLQALSNEDAWFLLTAKRSSQVNLMVGGMSNS